MDVGTWPITAPCRNFAYAITQVAPAGEIIALSTAGCGPVTLSLNIENCIVNGFSTYGISINRFGDIAPRINVLNSVIRDNHDAGLIVLDYGPGTAGGGPPANLGYATIVKSFFTGNVLTAIHAADNARIAVTDSVLAGNGNFAVTATENADFSSPEVNLERCTIARNTFGVYAGYPIGQDPHGLIRIAKLSDHEQ